MVRFYVARILAGKMCLGDVPVRWRDGVRVALESKENL